MDSPVGTGPDRRTSAASTASSGSPLSKTTSRKKSFSSLENQKRSTDPTQMARRQSMIDQKPAPGLIGKWWNSYVYGTK